MTTCPLVETSIERGIFPGPTHWKTGVPLTIPGRVTEQLRETVSPARVMGEDTERLIFRGSVGRDNIVSKKTVNNKHIRNYYIWYLQFREFIITVHTCCIFM